MARSMRSKPSTSPYLQKMRLADAANFCGLDPELVYDYLSEDLLKVSASPGGLILITPQDLIQELKKALERRDAEVRRRHQAEMVGIRSELEDLRGTLALVTSSVFGRVEPPTDALVLQTIQRARVLRRAYYPDRPVDQLLISEVGWWKDHVFPHLGINYLERMVQLTQDPGAPYDLAHAIELLNRRVELACRTAGGVDPYLDALLLRTREALQRIREVRLHLQQCQARFERSVLSRLARTDYLTTEIPLEQFVRLRLGLSPTSG